MKTYTYFIYTKNAKLFKLLLLTLSLCIGSINLNAQLQEAFVDTSSANQSATAKAGELQEAFVPKKPSPAKVTTSAKTTSSAKTNSAKASSANTSSANTSSVKTSSEKPTNNTKEPVAKKVNNTDLDVTAFLENGEEPYAWWQIAFFLYWGLGCLAIVIHTPFVFFFSSRIKGYIGGVAFSEKRRKLGLKDSTFEETQACHNLLEEGFANWVYVDDVLIPSCGNAYKKAFKALRQVEKFMPTDADLCYEISKRSNDFNNAGERSFAGSWLAIGLACFFVYITNFSLFMIGSLILYIVASLSPKYLKYLRVASNERHSGTAATLAIVGADFMSGRFTRTTTTWSDGSKTVEDDHTDSLLSFGFVLIAAAVIGMFISFFAVFNYLRNYVFYF